MEIRHNPQKEYWRRSELLEFLKNVKRVTFEM